MPFRDTSLTTILFNCFRWTQSQMILRIIYECYATIITESWGIVKFNFILCRLRVIRSANDVNSSPVRSNHWTVTFSAALWIFSPFFFYIYVYFKTKCATWLQRELAVHQSDSERDATLTGQKKKKTVQFFCFCTHWMRNSAPRCIWIARGCCKKGTEKICL